MAVVIGITSKIAVICVVDDVACQNDEIQPAFGCLFVRMANSGSEVVVGIAIPGLEDLLLPGFQVLANDLGDYITATGYMCVSEVYEPKVIGIGQTVSYIDCVMIGSIAKCDVAHRGPTPFRLPVLRRINSDLEPALPSKTREVLVFHGGLWEGRIGREVGVKSPDVRVYFRVHLRLQYPFIHYQR
jgi:hypothetical protein